MDSSSKRLSILDRLEPLSSSGTNLLTASHLEQLKDKEAEMFTIEFARLEFNAEKPLASGNFGSVFKGLYFGATVAIKHIVAVKGDQEILKYLDREVELLGSVVHPNIVQFLGMSVTGEGDLYLVSEFLNGGSLQGHLYDRSRVIGWRRRANYARDLSQALMYLHHRGMIHRDVKSENALLTRDLTRCKLGDFGLARRLDEKKGSIRKRSKAELRKLPRLSIAGTDAFMSPEIILGETYGKGVDVYSFGLCLYEIVLRKAPRERLPQEYFEFFADEFEADFAAQAADAPRAFADIILEATEHDSKKRPSMETVWQHVVELQKSIPKEPKGEKSPAGAKKSRGSRGPKPVLSASSSVIAIKKKK